MNEETTPQQQQAEPVAWDKPSASFNEWWDSDRHDNANPFEKDSYAHWAWAGWQAALAQRPWVGLTIDEVMSVLDHCEDSRIAVARDVEAKLKERNT